LARERTVSVQRARAVKQAASPGELKFQQARKTM
jgi:hypothetical protein